MATFKINFRGRDYENRWTRYREPKLRAIGLSDYEIMAIKYNRLSNPRIKWFLRDIRREVRRIAKAFELRSYEEAAEYRRTNYASLVDSGDIYEWDPYIRMGYFEE